MNVIWGILILVYMGNNETFAVKELEKEEVLSIPFEIKQAIVE